jgi:hypothetical protein
MKAFFASVLLCTASLLPLSANAMRFSLVGAANQSKPEYSPEVSTTGKFGFGGGGLLEFGLVPTLGLELGLLALPRKYEVGNTLAEQSGFQVPVLLRAHLGNIFSLGVGGYYTKYGSDLKLNGATTTYSAANWSDTDYGIATSVAFYSSIGPMTRLLFDARYLIGAKDNDDGAAEKKFRDIQLLLGVQFGF